MAARTSAIIWLLMGLVMGLVTLGVLGFGGYAVWHAQSNVSLVEKRIEAGEQEMNDLKTRRQLPGNIARFDEVDERLIASSKELNEVRQERFFAIGVLLSSVVPALLTLPFLAMFVVKWLQSRAAPKEVETQEEGTPTS